jgi:two-component system, chemotaxis family, chemotaxis protein CheY
VGTSTILVIDDDVDTREAIADVARAEGLQPVVREDGRRALEYLKSAAELPKLILLDLMMPKMSGWQFREAQAKDSRLRDIPVVFITGVESVPQNVEALKKPLGLMQIIRAIRRYCRVAG